MARHGHLGAATRHFRRLARDERGVVVVLMTLVMGVIFGFVGLAADASAWYTIQMRMQTAADAAALNAALTYFGGGGGYQEAAELDAGRNGFVHEVDGVEVEAELIESRIRVTITGPGGLFTFSRLFNDDPATIVAAAEAGRVTESLLCLLTLGTGAESLHTNSDAVVDARGCDVHVNSSNSRAMYTDSDSKLMANSICVRGGHDKKGKSEVTPTPTTGTQNCPQIADPFLNQIDAPSPGPCLSKYERSSGINNVPQGTYCGGIKIAGNATAVFEGVYIISNGELLFDSNSTIIGNNVTFYLINSNLKIASNSHVTLSAPTDGPLRGILFFEAAGNNKEHLIDSNSTLEMLLDGAFYFPSSKLRFDSNAEFRSAEACMIIIARNVEFNSNTEINMLSDADKCASLLPEEMSNTIITLTM